LTGVNNNCLIGGYERLYQKSSNETESAEFNSAVSQAEKDKAEMAQFQADFWSEVGRIQKTPTIDNLAINITKAGWERMKAEPEYREKMMGLIRRDTMGTFINQVDSVITIGGTEEEYCASSWSSKCSDFSEKTNEDSYVERRRKRKKQLKEMYDRMWLKHQMEQKRISQQVLAKKMGRTSVPAEYIVSDAIQLYDDLSLFN
jgi:hypothetical protein